LATLLVSILNLMAGDKTVFMITIGTARIFTALTKQQITDADLNKTGAREIVYAEIPKK
jgi:hypothetical protein